MKDAELKQLLAKMLPDDIGVDITGELYYRATPTLNSVLNTELLHLCWTVEEGLTEEQWNDYGSYIDAQTHSIYCDRHRIHASWQQRVTALAKVKGMTLKKALTGNEGWCSIGLVD